MTVANASMNPALRDFWTTPARNRVLYGGRDSTKSWDAAAFAVFLAQHCKIRVLCTRQHQARISESVYTLLCIQIDRFGLRDQFEILNTSIRHKETGSEFLFYGLWRHIEEIKSTESVDILWIEEGHGLTEAQWIVLEPTIRKEGSQVWIVFNPRFATDFAWKRFVKNPPPNTIKRLINYDENPWLSSTSRTIIEAKREEDYEEYLHTYRGVPRDNDDGVIIKRSWIEACFDAHHTIEPTSGSWTGGKTMGYDVADSGLDLNATTGMDGSVVIHLDEWKGGQDELVESTMRVHTTAQLLDMTMIGYDSIGVGAGVGSILNRLKWRRHFRFNAGGKVSHPKKRFGDTKITNEDYFSNLKAQMWWMMKQRILNTFLAVTKGHQFAADEMISFDTTQIDPDLLGKLVEELSTPQEDYDNAGKVKVESKKDLAKRDVVSPNVADSFIIANSRGLLGRRAVSDIL